MVFELSEVGRESLLFFSCDVARYGESPWFSRRLRDFQGDSLIGSSPCYPGSLRTDIPRNPPVITRNEAG